MKHLLLASGFVILLAGCGGSAGQTGRRTVDVRGFTAVSTDWGIDVEIATSEGWAVDVSADRQAIDRIVVEVRGSTLWIGLRAGTSARARYLASMGTGGRRPARSRAARRDAVGRRPGSASTSRAATWPWRSRAAASSRARSPAAASRSPPRAAASRSCPGTADRVDLAGSDRAKLKLTGLETPSMDAVLSGGSTAAVAVSSAPHRRGDRGFGAQLPGRRPGRAPGAERRLVAAEGITAATR